MTLRTKLVIDYGVSLRDAHNSSQRPSSFGLTTSALFAVATQIVTNPTCKVFCCMGSEFFNTTIIILEDIVQLMSEN